MASSLCCASSVEMLCLCWIPFLCTCLIGGSFPVPVCEQYVPRLSLTSLVDFPCKCDWRVLAALPWHVSFLLTASDVASLQTHVLWKLAVCAFH